MIIPQEKMTARPQDRKTARPQDRKTKRLYFHYLIPVIPETWQETYQVL